MKKIYGIAAVIGVIGLGMMVARVSMKTRGGR